MTFIDQRLPEEIELGAVRHEDAILDIVPTDGGHEVRNARHEQDPLSYDIAFPPGKYTAAVNDAVKRMVRASRIGLHSFRFRDWDPTMHELEVEPFGTGDGATTQFQIKKSWTVGGVTASRKITRPVSSLQIFRNGVLLSSGYTVNYSTGLVTFTAPPADGVVLAASGLFDIPVRFDLAYSATGLTGWLEHIDTLRLVEVRE